jgi:hypothetical protein
MKFGIVWLTRVACVAWVGMLSLILAEITHFMTHHAQPTQYFYIKT